MLRHIQGQVQEDVKRMMAEQLQGSPVRWDRQITSNTCDFAKKPSLIASCSAFGHKVPFFLIDEHKIRVLHGIRFWELYTANPFVRLFWTQGFQNCS